MTPSRQLVLAARLSKYEKLIGHTRRESTRGKVQQISNKHKFENLHARMFFFLLDQVGTLLKARNVVFQQNYITNYITNYNKQIWTITNRRHL